MAKKKATKKAPVKKTTTKKVAKKVTKKVAKKVTKKVVKKAPAKKAPAKKAPAKKVAAKPAASKPPKTTSMMHLKVGDSAPTFTLKDQNGNSISLESLKGSNVVVYFYPKAMTPGCTVQACSLRDSQKELKDHNIVVLGISGDDQKLLKKFEEKDHLNFTLLSDADHKVASAYGSWGQKQFMGRTYDGILRQSFLINPEGKIVHVMSKVDTKTHHDDVINFFKNLK